MKAGKKYRHNITNDTIYTCLVILPSGSAVVSWDQSVYPAGESIIFKEQFRFYEEYVEPKKGTVWINIYENIAPSHPFASRQSADLSASAISWKRIACIEVPWTEGQGL
jgi:hypothetical protein